MIFKNIVTRARVRAARAPTIERTRHATARRLCSFPSFPFVFSEMLIFAREKKGSFLRFSAFLGLFLILKGFGDQKVFFSSHVFLVYVFLFFRADLGPSQSALMPSARALHDLVTTESGILSVFLRVVFDESLWLGAISRARTRRAKRSPRTLFSGLPPSFPKSGRDFMKLETFDTSQTHECGDRGCLENTSVQIVQPETTERYESLSKSDPNRRVWKRDL